MVARVVRDNLVDANGAAPGAHRASSRPPRRQGRAASHSGIRPIRPMLSTMRWRCSIRPEPVHGRGKGSGLRYYFEKIVSNLCDVHVWFADPSSNATCRRSSGGRPRHLAVRLIIFIRIDWRRPQSRRRSQIEGGRNAKSTRSSVGLPGRSLIFTPAKRPTASLPLII